MNLEKVFKNLIIIQFLLAIGALFYGGFLASLDDASLEEDVVFSSVEAAISIVALANIVNLYLLFKFKPIGKLLFVPLLLIIYSLSLGLPIEDFQIVTHFDFLLDGLFTMIDGAIITMLYLTAIKDKFVK